MFSLPSARVSRRRVGIAGNAFLNVIGITLILKGVFDNVVPMGLLSLWRGNVLIPITAVLNNLPQFGVMVMLSRRLVERHPRSIFHHLRRNWDAHAVEDGAWVRLKRVDCSRDRPGGATT